MPDGKFRPTEVMGCQSIVMLAATGGGDEQEDRAKTRATNATAERTATALTAEN